MSFINKAGRIESVPGILRVVHHVFDGGLHLVHNAPLPQLVRFNDTLAKRDYIIDHPRVRNDAVESAAGGTVGPWHMRQGPVPLVHQGLARFLVGVLGQPLHELIEQGRITHNLIAIGIHDGHEDGTLFLAEHAPCGWE